MAMGALTVGIAAIPHKHRRNQAPANVDAFVTDLAAALFALTSVPSGRWSARALDLPRGESPLRHLVQSANAATEYFLCDLAGLSERGEHGAAASALQAVIVLAPTGCDDRDLTDFLRELPGERILGVVLTT